MSFDYQHFLESCKTGDLEVAKSLYSINNSFIYKCDNGYRTPFLYIMSKW